jgi:uridine kinase
LFETANDFNLFFAAGQKLWKRRAVEKPKNDFPTATAATREVKLFTPAG